MECPSIHELIADYEFEWSESPELRLYRPKSTSEGLEGQVEVQRITDFEGIVDLLHSALRDNKVFFQLNANVSALVFS